MSDGNENPTRETDWRLLPGSDEIERLAVSVGDRSTEQVVFLGAAGGVLQACEGFATALALFTFVESALLADLQDRGTVYINDAVSRHGYQRRHALGLMRFLATQGFFREQAGEGFYATPLGRAAFSRGSIGHLRWFLGGYGEVMSKAGGLLRGEIKYHQDITRNATYTGVGSSEGTSAFFDEAPYSVFARSGHKVIGDLGCGGGSFLIEFARRHPEHRGIGVDIAADAIEVANRAAADAGVADRVSFVTGDAFDLSKVAEQCADVEVFYSFAVEHELLRDGEQAVLSHIDRMAELFPGKRYLLGEPCIDMVKQDGTFYWIHILSEQGMPQSVDGWVDTLGRLKKAKLTRVFRPDHLFRATFFDIEL